MATVNVLILQLMFISGTERQSNFFKGTYLQQQSQFSGIYFEMYLVSAHSLLILLSVFLQFLPHSSLVPINKSVAISSGFFLSWDFHLKTELDVIMQNTPLPFHSSLNKLWEIKAPLVYRALVFRQLNLSVAVIYKDRFEPYIPGSVTQSLPSHVDNSLQRREDFVCLLIVVEDVMNLMVYFSL